ncbi:IS21-like element helper ATPase IstB [Virgibacillus sp. NKC19-3]|uniref:IS21-like element helper ATPase IstB n=1 Tax=Virgibacillus saliphilus TaxID=2831674 RepID=UPI001C9A3DB3|nr:IS21-like element helper ATPase IstB [Virgibacillus sp. NKC19-3]MBY7142476.1 IS21-like element helper ATPase IstB [Virgibacillus sp. NKC19-3]MBY7144588.1 IS21-like element helper ATPase IstB [Virgibacillus sp. NKC19-3]
MSSYKELEAILRTLRFVETSEHLPELIKKAETQAQSYTQFLLDIMSYEQKRRKERVIEKRLKWATFPTYKTLDEFSLREQPSLKKIQFHQLTDLTWLDQLYNLILLGPTGVGKTHLAIGLGIKAIHEGYKVTFISMGELIHVLKTEEITRKSQIRLKRIRNSNLVIIDDLMFMAMDQREANLFFHLVNDLYNQSSIILTSNKGPSDWGELLGDPAITAAILDRIIHRAEVIQLGGDSYRLKHRSSIFDNKTVQN